MDDGEIDKVIQMFTVYLKITDCTVLAIYTRHVYEKPTTGEYIVEADGTLGCLREVAEDMAQTWQRRISMRTPMDALGLRRTLEVCGLRHNGRLSEQAIRQAGGANTERALLASVLLLAIAGREKGLA